MSIFVSRDILLVKKFIKHVCVYANKKEKCQAVYYQPLGIFFLFRYIQGVLF